MTETARASSPPDDVRPLRSARRAFTRDRICTAAKEVFFRKGFAAASVEEIALAAGTKRPTLYTYFRDKDEIIAAVVEGYEARLAPVIAQLPGPVPDEAEVAAWIAMLAAFVGGERTPTEMLVTMGNLVDTPPVVQRFGESLERMFAERLDAFARARGEGAGREHAWAMAVLRELGWALCYRSRHGDTETSRHKLAVATDLFSRFARGALCA